MLSGLPLVLGKLPLEHAGDAAERVNLTVEKVKQQPEKLSDTDLPAVVLMNDGGLEVLWALKRDVSGRSETAVMSLPGDAGRRVEVPAGDLRASAGRGMSSYSDRFQGVTNEPKKRSHRSRRAGS